MRDKFKKTIWTIAFGAMFFNSNAQKSTSFLELSPYLMTQNYLGDVNGNNLSALSQEARLGLGVQLKQNVNSLFSYGFDVNFGSIYSHDNLHGNEARDYQVDTDLLNVGAFADVHFIKFGKYYQRNSHTPFIHFGVGALSYTPHLNTNAQYPDYINLENGAGSAFTYNLGFGWRIRRSLKTFYNIGIYYNGTNTSRIEGFDYNTSSNSLPSGVYNTMDGFLSLKFGMSFGFFEQ